MQNIRAKQNKSTKPIEQKEKKKQDKTKRKKQSKHKSKITKQK